LNGDLRKTLFDSHSIVFLVLNRDFIIHIHFTQIAASNTASDDVKNRSHTEYLIQTYYILVLF